MAYSEMVILGYLAISAIPFFVIGGQMLPDMFSGIKMEDCGYANAARAASRSRAASARSTCRWSPRS